MRIVMIDPSRLCDRLSAHEYLKKLFGFPDYYGKNLDALYDCLTDLQVPTIVIIGNEPAGDYADRVVKVIEEAADNGFIRFIKAGKENKQ